MSVSAENVDQSAELTLYRDDARPGYAIIEATTFGDAGAWTEPFGSFRIRDLLIALHALTLNGKD